MNSVTEKTAQYNTARKFFSAILFRQIWTIYKAINTFRRLKIRMRITRQNVHHLRKNLVTFCDGKGILIYLRSSNAAFF